MKNAVESWFKWSPSSAENSNPSAYSSSTSSTPSLLADWNSYTSSRSAEESGSTSTLGFDIEAAVRSANDKVTGTFEVVSKGVKELPGSFQSATNSIPSGKTLMYFGLLLATGAFFVFVAFVMFLPVMVLVPQKFAICFTLGCGFIMSSVFVLKGPKTQLAHMSSKERLPFTFGFLGSMVGTIYVSMVLHSYILSVIFSVLQVFALTYYTISYFPGGSAGLKFLTSGITSSITKCFWR